MSRLRRDTPAQAGLAALGLAAALSFPRLPPSPEGFVPRHAGFWLYRLAMSAAAQPWGASAFALLTAASLAIAAAWAAWSAWPKTRRALGALRVAGYGLLAARLAAAAVGALVIAAGTRLACALFIDVIENAWFFPQSADLREPLALWLALSVCLALGLRVAEQLWLWILSERPDFSACRAWAAPGVVLLVVWLSFGGFAAWRWDEAKPSLGAAAGFVQSTPRRRRVVVLAEEDGRPAASLHVLGIGQPGEIDYSDLNVSAAETYAGRGASVWRLAALRYLYGGQTVRMDAAGLRRGLALGADLGDGLAAATLAENLGAAPVTDEDRTLLEGLADERRWRVGARAAAALSRASRRFGRADLADAWEARAAAGAGGVTPGLLTRPLGPARPGVIEGAVFPWKDARAALYARPSEGEDVSLGPARLVSSASIPRSGRFEFRGLGQGDYFLVFAFDVPQTAEAASVQVDAQPGWLALSKARGRLDLPPLRVRWKSAVREASGR